MLQTFISSEKLRNVPCLDEGVKRIVLFVSHYVEAIDLNRHGGPGEPLLQSFDVERAITPRGQI